MQTIKQYIILGESVSAAGFKTVGFAGDIMQAIVVGHIEIQNDVPEVDVSACHRAGCKSRPDKSLVGWIVGAQQVTVRNTAACVGSESLQVEPVPCFQGYGHVSEQVGCFLCGGFVVKYHLINFVKPVGIGTWFQSEDEIVVKPFHVHEVLVADILQHARIFIHIGCTGQIFKYIVGLQYGDLGSIYTTTKTDTQVIQERRGLRPQACIQKECQ